MANQMTYKCPRCGLENRYVLKEVATTGGGKNIGMYCADCDRWIKWIGQGEFAKVLAGAIGYTELPIEKRAPDPEDEIPQTAKGLIDKAYETLSDAYLKVVDLLARAAADADKLENPKQEDDDELPWVE